MIRYCSTLSLLLWMLQIQMSITLMHGDHFDGALGHGLVHGNNNNHQEPNAEPSSMIEYSSHLPSYLHNEPLHHLGHPVPEPEQQHHPMMSHDIHPEPMPYHLNGLQLRFHPEDLAVHGYDNQMNHHEQSPPHHHVHHAYPHTMHHSPHPIPLPEHYDPFYGHRKPGDGFGPGGHFSVMPHQEIKYFPVPEPVAVYKPVPVEKPYPIPVDKPYPVKIDRPVPEPYVAKVVQPIIHKQAIIKSHITHQTYDIPYPQHQQYPHPYKKA
uniref:Uncharacterized histidine-rich protein DDB_G0274557-like n=1 Tax=Dermatophagoides pteronyssinus TaxID=6956 RepID=A0A6P6YDK6_DERPT|nr:uncharacterized histidine-rich protein DDB_G0274557-like [Dermatophagoides pteronyssinus]